MTLFSVRGRRWLAWVIGAAVSGMAARGQSAASAALPTSAQAVLVEMASHAGVIFTGEVLGITRADASGYVDVKFRVDQPVRGVSRTGAYVLREWAGLWAGGADRYKVGQRYLMLLPPRGSSGMSAPVDGMDGAIPLTAAGDSPLADGLGIAPVDKAIAAPEAQVDLRWLAARAARTTVSSGSAVRPGTAKTRVSGVTLAAGESEGLSSGGGSTGGGRAIAAPIPEPVEGGEGPPGDGWAGAIAPLPGTGASTGSGASYPAATKLSSILALLAIGNGSAHVSR